MMTNLFKYTLLIFLLSFAACSSNDDGAPSVPNGQPQPGDALELTVSAADFVTDGAPDTRATDNGNETTFEKGDRVGVIILDENSHLIYDNIPYEYNNGNWTFDSNNDDGKGGCYYDTKAETYIVYYPYSRVADGVTSVDILKTKFAPKFNQSDIKDYRASDLMVWSDKIYLTSSEKKLDAVLEHAFASISLAPIVQCILDDGKQTPYTGSYASEVSSISDVSLTIDNAVYVPFQASDGSLRFIVPAGITPDNIRCFYTIAGNIYSNTISISGKIAVNTRYACEAEIGDVTYSLNNAHVGDFYCKKNKDEGYLIPGDVDLNNNQKTACIGIVFWVGSKAFDEDPLLKKEHSDCTHGLVVALQDVGDPMLWSENDELVQDWVKANYEGINLSESNKMCGYSNTLALKAYNTAKGNDSGHRVKPCDAIQKYSDTNPAPKNSSGWYFPSVTELRFLCWGQGKNGGTVGRDYLNAQIGRAGVGSQINGNGNIFYWSSSEHSSSIFYAWRVDFKDGNSYANWDKHRNWFHVRPLLAF